MQNKLIVAFGVLSGAMLALGGVASADSAVDPTGGAYGDGISNVQSFITGTAAGPLFLLAGVVVAIMVGLRWLKKSKSAAAG